MYEKAWETKIGNLSIYLDLHRPDLIRFEHPPTWHKFGDSIFWKLMWGSSLNNVFCQTYDVWEILFQMNGLSKF